MIQEENIVSKNDWERILKTMEFYKRECGYVDFVDKKFTFFDADPQTKGVSACFVRKVDVIQYIDNY